MDRREFIKKAGVGFAAGERFGHSGHREGPEKVQVEDGHDLAAELSSLPRGRRAFCRPGQGADGGGHRHSRLRRGELVPPLQAFDAVSQGTVELAHGAAYYQAGKAPASQFFSAVPFGLNAQGMNAWFYAGGGMALYREVYAPFNVVPFPMGNSGVQMAGWFRKEIKSMADFKGLKMRIPGLGGKVLAKAGGTPVLLAGGEIYTALERGTIDATEWVGPYHDLRLGLYRAAKHYYYPGMARAGNGARAGREQEDVGGADEGLPVDHRDDGSGGQSLDALRVRG